MNIFRLYATITRLLGCVLLAAILSVAAADNILYTRLGFNDGNVGVTLGYDFTPSVAIAVTSLGVYDGGSDGAGLQAPPRCWPV